MIKFSTACLPLLLLTAELGMRMVSAMEVVRFNLVDATTHAVVLQDIQDGAVLDKAVYGYGCSY